MKKIIKSILIKVSRKILSKKIIAFIENCLNIRLFILSSPDEVENVLKSPVPHLRIFPLATYVPWKIDKNFKKTFNIAKDFTLVDEFRMYELRHLALQACHLKGDFLEVGVWRGGSSAIIQAALTERKSKNNFYIADTFEGVVKAGTKSDTFYKGGEHSTLIYLVQMCSIKL